MIKPDKTPGVEKGALLLAEEFLAVVWLPGVGSWFP